MVKVLNASESYTLKMVNFMYVNFTSIKLKTLKGRK